MATDPNDPTTTEEEHQPVGVDRVQEVSKKPDGTPDQTDGFEVIEDPEADADAATESRAPRRGRARKVEPETTAER